MVILEKPQTLAELRRESGIKTAVIIERARRLDPEFPTTHAGYLGIEERGTRDYWKIHALGCVFGIPPDAMARIVKPKIL